MLTFLIGLTFAIIKGSEKLGNLILLAKSAFTPLGGMLARDVGLHLLTILLLRTEFVRYHEINITMFPLL
jgi:hypothetical protein